MVVFGVRGFIIVSRRLWRTFCSTRQYVGSEVYGGSLFSFKVKVANVWENELGVLFRFKALLIVKHIRKILRPIFCKECTIERIAFWQINWFLLQAVQESEIRVWNGYVVFWKLIKETPQCEIYMYWDVSLCLPIDNRWRWIVWETWALKREGAHFRIATPFVVRRITYSYFTPLLTKIGLQRVFLVYPSPGLDWLYKHFRWLELYWKVYFKVEPKWGF